MIETKAMLRIGGGFVRLETKLCNQHDQVVQVGTWTILVRRDPSLPLKG